MRAEETPSRGAGRLATFVLRSSLGMLWAWRYCAYKTELLFSGFTGTNMAITPSWVVDSLCCLAVLAALPPLARRMRPRTWRATVVAGTLAMSLGTLVTGLCAAGGLAAGECAGGVATGVGSGILYVACGACYASVPDDDLETLVPLQMLWALLGCLVAPLFEGGVAGIALVSLLPVVCGALVLRSATKVPVRRASPEVEGLRPPSLRQVVVLLVCVFVSQVAGSTSMLSPATTEISEVIGPTTTFYRVVFLLVCLLILALSLVLISSSRHFALTSVLGRGTPVIIVAMAASLAADDPAADIACSLVIAFVETYVVMACHIWALRLGKFGLLAPHEAFALFMLAYVSGIAGGNALSSWLVSSAAGASSDVFAAIAVGGLAVILLILPDAVRCDDETSAACGDDPVAAGLPATAGSEGATGSATPESRMLALAEAHDLTQRETDVCLLLARGRSRPYIREKLRISKNTVNSHVAHAYAKLGIHSNQELLDLLEDVAADA